jgi:primosomal protein N' (replication factor Y)
MYFVEVIVPLALNQTFTYQVSEAEYNYIQPGMRIAVPFGKNKMYSALAIGLHQKAPTLYQAKEIHEILDSKPIVNQIQINHWHWIASYYMCSIGDVYRMALPSSFLLESETLITLNKDVFINDTNLSDAEFLLYEALQHQTSLKIIDVISILNKKTVFPVIQKLLDKKVITIHEEINETYKPKLIKYVKLNDDYKEENKLIALLDSLKGAKQKDLVMQFFQLSAQNKKPIPVKILLEKAQVAATTLKSLVEKAIFEEYYVQEDRVQFGESQKNNLQLSTAQQKAFNEISNNFQTNDVCLLHGITASGKTEVYIKQIEKYLENKKQVLYLLPEIALTTQLVFRLTKHFGNKVAVFHSKYSNNERVEVWNQVLENSDKAQIVIGARSALFLPFSNLGLIIIDEEHEQTFKQQDPAPRYHARDAAIVLAKAHNSKVLLGSATPSIETFYNAQSGKFGLVNLNERFGKVQLPEVTLVDLKDAYFRKKMSGHFSLTLIDAMNEALLLGEQIILFQNRRGFSPVLECLTCGHVPQCTNCDVSLTYHKFKNQLRCHYCGYAIAKPTNCHSCSSVHLSTKGFGTEQVELELAELFPTKNIKRMDQDTTRGKYSFENLIDSFKNREIDILVGTQMLAKGLDFDNVTLVGILNADNMLYQPDFRAFERSFQMMTQVAGRSGRSEKRGNVIIQTYNPVHNIIQQVTNNQYEEMYKEQLYERKIYNYPPFCRLVKITLKHKEFEKLKEGSFWLYNVFTQHLNIPVLGPEEPAINRVRNQYLRTILIKIPQNQSLTSIKKTIQKILNSFEAVPQYRSIKVTVNVDFY